MKNLSTIIDESKELNDLDYILESTNDFKKISTNILYNIWQAVSGDDYMDTIIDAMHGDNNAVKLLKEVPYVQKYIFDYVGERKGVVMISWLIDSISGMDINPKIACDVISTYFNKLMATGGIDKFIGAGMEGFVIDVHDQVVKVFYKPMNASNKKFYELCKTKKYSVLPKVTHLSSRTVSMEKLDVTKDSVRVNKSITDFCNLMMDKNYKTTDKKALKAFEEMTLVAEELGVKMYVFDAHIWNVGLRGNGDVVLFDY